MILKNIKEVPNYKVEKWLNKNIKNITKYQEEWIRNEEIIRFAPFKFYEKKKKVTNIFFRISILFIWIPFVLLALNLPFNFLITGTWGYSNKNINWFTAWAESCGF